MSAGTFDIKIEAGTDWPLTLYLKDDADNPKVLTGYTASMDIRTELDGPIVKNLTSVGGTPQIVIDGAAGKITIALTDVETAALGIKQGVYDLLLTDAGGTGNISKLLKGTVTVDPVVTRV